MSIVKKFFEFLNEKEEVSEKEKRKVITITCRDEENSLVDLIKYIQANGNTGHSFSIVVDPDGDKDQKKTFSWDGDGSDRIFDISSEMVEEEEEEEKEVDTIEETKSVDLRNDNSKECKGCGNPIKAGEMLCKKCEERGFYIDPKGKVISPEDTQN